MSFTNYFWQLYPKKSYPVFPACEYLFIKSRNRSGSRRTNPTCVVAAAQTGGRRYSATNDCTCTSRLLGPTITSNSPASYLYTRSAL